MKRPHMGTASIGNLARALHLSRGVPIDEAMAFAKKAFTGSFKDKKIRHVHTVQYGETKIVDESLWNHLDKHRGDVIAPSGSIYKPTTEGTCISSMMIIDKMAERKVEKNAMLKYKSLGDKVMQSIKKLSQASIKIEINSLPGDFGSKFSVFFDKGGYNAITSLGRALITNSCINAEQLLGGNFVWFSAEDAMNHVIIASRECDREKMRHIVAKHGLKIPTADDLKRFIESMVRQYNSREDLSDCFKMVDALTSEERIYVYYYNNMRALLWENKAMRDVTEYILNAPLDDLNTEGIDPQELFKQDDDMLAMVGAIMGTRLEGRMLHDLPKEASHLARAVVFVCNEFIKRMEGFTEVIHAFCYSDLNIPKVLGMRAGKRNTVVVSDTDSVIFQTKAWIEWFNGDCVKMDDRAFQISALVTYWLTKVNAHVMKRYSIQQGAKDDYVYQMSMKNEYLYPTMVIYDVKKVYAGIITIQEGVVSDPETDIKGGALRGSKICKPAAEFIEHFIVDMVLKPAVNGPVRAVDCLKEVSAYERKIKDLVREGDVTYLKLESIRDPDHYANATSSAWMYLEAWNQFFGSRYGMLSTPTKTPIIPLVKPTEAYFQMVKGKDLQLYNKMMKWMEKYKRFPSSISINSAANVLPDLLAPIVDTRSIIYHNIKPVYLTMDQLNMGIGFSDKKLLVSDLH